MDSLKKCSFPSTTSPRHKDGADDCQSSWSEGSNVESNIGQITTMADSGRNFARAPLDAADTAVIAQIEQIDSEESIRATASTLARTKPSLLTPISAEATEAGLQQCLELLRSSKDEKKSFPSLIPPSLSHPQSQLPMAPSLHLRA